MHCNQSKWGEKYFGRCWWQDLYLFYALFNFLLPKICSYSTLKPAMLFWVVLLFYQGLFFEAKKGQISQYHQLVLSDGAVALSDTQIDSIQCLNFAQNWFNSIFDSKFFHENSIQKIIQFLIIFVIQFSISFNSKWVILIQFNILFNLK